MAEKFNESKGILEPPVEQSPEKKRMMTTNRPTLRLISRSCFDSDEEGDVIRTQVTPTAANMEQRILDTSASRKRKALIPSQSPVVLASPTTHIIRKIDGIRLNLPTPVQEKSMNPHNPGKESSHDVSKTIDMPISTSDLHMEQYLSRPEHSANMKRLLSDEDDDEEKRNEFGKTKGTSKIPKTVSGHSLSHSSSVRVSIAQPSSQLPSNIIERTAGPTSPVVNLSCTTQPHDSVSSHSSVAATILSYPPTPITLISSTNTSTQPQSKPKSFSINDLLAKDPQNERKTIHPINSFSFINPSLLLLYQQHWLSQSSLNSNTGLFQGETAEADNAIRTTSNIQSTHSKSAASDDNISLQLPSDVQSESIKNSLVVHSDGINRTELQNSNDDANSNTEKANEGRQNALLHVGEAHLAILPDEDGDTPLHLAIIQENIPLTFYLVQLISGVSMNLDIANNLRQTPLHLAVITRQPMLVNLLVKSGASVNHPDRRGNTCIHLAAQRKSVSILHILAQAESQLPDYNSRNFAGLTPVHVATREGCIDVLKFLFQVGANKNMADSCSGRTPLHYAVEAQNFQMCNFLLENNCNVNAVTFSGNTPLHVAAGRRLKEIVALLMAYGANPAIANGEGDFPSDLPASLLMQRAKMNAQ